MTRSKINPDYLFVALHEVDSAKESISKHMADLPKEQNVLRDVAGVNKQSLIQVHDWLLGAIESFGYSELLNK